MGAMTFSCQLTKTIKLQSISLAILVLLNPVSVSANWTNISPPAGPIINDFAVAPNLPTTIYGTSVIGGNNGIYVSTDSGTTWTVTPFGAGTPYNSIAVRPNNSQSIVAGEVNLGVDYSLDGGTNIQASTGVANHTDRVYSFSASAPNIVYAGADTGFSSGQLSQSNDAGINWFTRTVAGDNDPAVTAVAVDPSSASIIYAGVNPDGVGIDGIYKSTNGGDTWSFKNGYTPTSANTIAINPSDTGIIFAGTGGSGVVYRSIDGGETWATLPTAAITNFTSVFSITISPTTPSIIYAGGTGMEKVIVSTDCGASWNPVDDTGLAVGPDKLYYDAGANLVYANAANGGVFTKAAVTVSTGACPASMVPAPADPGADDDDGGGSSSSSIDIYALIVLISLLILRTWTANRISRQFTLFG